MSDRRTSASEFIDLIDDVSPTWLNAALQHSGLVDAEIIDLRVEPLGPGSGLLGDKARLYPTYRSAAGPTSLIIKLPSTDAGSRQVGMMLNVWDREVAFYRDVAPRSPGARLANCYLAAANPSQQQWVLLLEDCVSDPIDSRTGATDAQADAAVKALAEFHSHWWQATDTFDWMPGFDAGGVGGLGAAWVESVPVFLERYSEYVPEPAGQWVLELAPRLGEWSARAAGEPLTMVHADYRLDNLLFDDGRVTIIDWQTAMRAPAAMDLSSFVTTSLSIDDRRRLEATLIDRYLETLQANGVAVDRAWFERSYDENVLWWMGQYANNLARLYPDAETQIDLDVMVERVYAAGVDRNVGYTLR